MFLSKPEDWVVQDKLTSYRGGVWKTKGKLFLTMAVPVGLQVTGQICSEDFSGMKFKFLPAPGLC